MIKEGFLLVDECEDDDASQQASSVDPNLMQDVNEETSQQASTSVDSNSEQDVKDTVEKLCDDVVRAEMQEDFVEATTPAGLTIKVTKRIANIAAHFAFNPFDYIRAEPLSLPKPRFSNTIRERKHARSSIEPSVHDEDFEPSIKRSREDSNKNASKFKPKRMKCITENCKVCSVPMDQRTFMPDGETFYCSSECIHKKVKQVRKVNICEFIYSSFLFWTLTHRDQIFVTDRKGRLHANYVPDIDSLEAFLLRRPNYEPCVRQNEDEAKASPPSMSSTADDSRVRIRNTFSDQIIKRCSFHDIDLTDKKAKELSHQVEYDLFEFLKSVRDIRYRNWCRGFLKFLMNSTSVFMEKLVNGGIDTARLVRIPDRILDSELHKMDEIEAAIEPTSKSEEPTPSPVSITPVVESKPKPSPLSFPFKYRAEPLKPNAVLKPTPLETGKSAIDDILGTNKDTTSKHMSHLYDANCEICKKNSEMESAMLEKVKKNKQEKERGKEIRRNGSKEELVIKKSSTYTRKVSRFEDSSNFKQQTKVSTSRRNYSDDDVSPGGFGMDDDYTEPPPPGHTPESNRDLPQPQIKSSSRTNIPDSAPLNSFDSKRTRRRSRSPVSPIYNRVPPARPQLSSIDSNRLSPSEFRHESWRRPDNRPQATPEQEPVMIEDELKLVWTGLFDYPNKYRYKCEFSLVKNRIASNDLQSILPETMRVQGSIECKVVWSYLESLRSAWTKDVITLLMHPPTDNKEYQMYVSFYTYLEESKRMTVIDVKRCLELKDVYLFALPPHSSLHPSCDVDDGPGLSSRVQGCGNILAVVVRQRRSYAKANQSTLPVMDKTDGGVPTNVPLRPGREEYQMEQLAGKRSRKLKGESPYDKKPRLIRSLPDEKPHTKATFLNDIPIVDKSPFDNTPEKSPLTSSEHSLNIDESNQNLLLDQPSFNEDRLVESPIPPPPPPNDDNDKMEMSSDEEGEVVSPASLPPPPMPPSNLSQFVPPPPVPPPQLNGPIPGLVPMPLPPPGIFPRLQGVPPLNGLPPGSPRMIRGRGMPPMRRPMLRGSTMNGALGMRSRMPPRMPPQGAPPPRISDANMQGPVRGRFPPPPMQRPPGVPPLNSFPQGAPQVMRGRGGPMRRPILRLNGPTNGTLRGRMPPRMPPPPHF